MLTLLHCVCALVLFFIVQFSPLVCKRIFAIEYDLLHELVKWGGCLVDVPSSKRQEWMNPGNSEENLEIDGSICKT